MPAPGPDLRLVTTPARPGLHIYAPDAHTTPTASFACRCGFVRRGRGRDEVLEIAMNHHKHLTACPLQQAPETMTA
jgi:hypothetical protein